MCTCSSEGQDISAQVAVASTRIYSHIGFRAGMAVQHRPPRNSGQIPHACAQNDCIALAHPDTAPTQGSPQGDTPSDVDATMNRSASVCVHGSLYLAARGRIPFAK